MDGELPPPAPGAERTPLRVVVLSMDAHLGPSIRHAEADLRRTIPGLRVDFFAASEWEAEGEGRDEVLRGIAEADLIVAGMLFLENQFEPLLPALTARAPHCDAMLGCLSAPGITKLTRLGKLDMSRPQSGPMALLQRLRGKPKSGGAGKDQARLLRRLPRILKYVPGTAQDLRVYFLSMQYWLGGSGPNIRNMLALLIDRYAAGARAGLQGTLTVEDPVVYPETALYHPNLPSKVTDDPRALPRPAGRARPRVGVLVMRSYVLSGDTGHYDGVIAALERQGLEVVPAFASGLDARPAIDRFFRREDGRPSIDALLSLTGFSLIGGPAYNDAESAAKVLGELDVPYLSAHAIEFQSLADWASGERGLSPVEATMMIAMPELDGAAAPTIFGGRSSGTATQCEGCHRRCTFGSGDGPSAMLSCPERCDDLADRVRRMVALRRKARAEKKAAVVLFNFPPNSGAVGTAASLSVFESLFNLLARMKEEGYSVELPPSADDLRQQLIEGNSAAHGTEANLHYKMPVDHHLRAERKLGDVEAQWGAAPGTHQTDGQTLFVLGKAFGNVFVGLQPAFGYEGDPMRLLFERDFAPTHAFCAFYRYIREVFEADAVVHFGTHGALEFMPGKQTALSGECWPSYLIGGLPNIYLYAANNPSEAAIAKRRSAATTVSYLTASITKAGLYRSMSDLRSTLDRWRATAPDAPGQRRSLALLAQAQAASLDLCPAEPAWDDTDAMMGELAETLLEYERTLIPEGLHIAGARLTEEERFKALCAVAGEGAPDPIDERALREITAGGTAASIASRYGLEGARARLEELARVDACLQEDTEITGLLRALDGRFIAPVAGGDLVSNTAILPTGRNIHGFDPFRMPSAFALREGQEQAELLLKRHCRDHGSLPETIALVLWGTDNLKSEGTQIAQALALIGAEPRFDHYGRLTGAALLPLERLGRARIDVYATLSGIFRDLLPMQSRLLAEATLLAARAEDEPLDRNFIRKHSLAYQEAHGCDLATAALRVFSNADGAYGANVNRLIDAGCWTEEGELADTYTSRKCFAYGADGSSAKQSELLESILGDVDLAYQNLESVELGITTIDHYFDTLGGIGGAVKKARGRDAPVYIGDQTCGNSKVRSLSEQVALETRTRTLNPKWYEGMLKHGYEGVRQIEAQVTHTFGWSATTGKVAPWVYENIAETFVLDQDLRERLASLNPRSCAKVAGRLLEASERRYWSPTPETLRTLQSIEDDLEDRIEGIMPMEGAAI